MNQWRQQLKIDPTPTLLASDNEAVQYFTRRDLLGIQVGPLQQLWELPAAQKILKKQGPDGSWSRSGKGKHPAINYCLIETWRNFRFLIEIFQFTIEHPQVEQAAEYIFSCQTEHGDIRGILANQYTTYYTGAIMALLIQAGYADDPRIKKGFHWLLAMRQDDLGWSIPLITHKFDRATQYRLTSQFATPVEPDRIKPFSHNCTGMVLRAFAVHKKYKDSQAALVAADLLISRFFQKDAYTSYQAASYWVRFDYPFWWNNLVAALDSVSRIGISQSDPRVNHALEWLIDHQEPNGLWKHTYAKAVEKDSPKIRETSLWITLAISRIFKRLAG